MADRAVMLANVGTSVVTNYWSSQNMSKEEQATWMAREDRAARKATLLEHARKVGSTRASAETNSIARIVQLLGRDETELDQVHLFVSDTEEGQLAAEVLEELLASTHQTRVEVHLIRGLQVESAHEFLRFGLPGYIEKVYEVLRNSPPQVYRRIFNPTGGFKSLVPYLTIISMMQSAETLYIFERSEELINLQSLPVALDPKLVKEALPLLGEAIEEDRLFTAPELEEALGLGGPLYRSPHASLWTTLGEEEEPQYFPTGLGQIVFEDADRAEDSIWLSSMAAKEFGKADPDTVRSLRRALRKMRSPSHREAGVHDNYARRLTDCQCYGYSSSPYRIFFLVDPKESGDRVLVTRIFPMSEHDKKEKILHQEGGIFQKDFSGWTEMTEI